MNKVHVSTWVKLAVMAAVIAAAFPEFSFAAAASNLKESVTTVTKGMRDMPIILSGLSYLAAGATMLHGAGLLKKHADQPTSVPLMQGVSRILAGGFIASLPYAISWTVATFKLQGSCGEGSKCAVYIPLPHPTGNFGF